MFNKHRRIYTSHFVEIVRAMWCDARKCSTHFVRTCESQTRCCSHAHARAALTCYSFFHSSQFELIEARSDMTKSFAWISICSWVLRCLDASMIWCFVVVVDRIVQFKANNNGSSKILSFFFHVPCFSLRSTVPSTFLTSHSHLFL